MKLKELEKRKKAHAITVKIKMTENVGGLKNDQDYELSKATAADLVFHGKATVSGSEKSKLRETVELKDKIENPED